MKLSSVTLLSVAATAAAKTVFVTQVQYVYGSLIKEEQKTAAPAQETIYVNGKGQRVNKDGGPLLVPTTLVSLTASPSEPAVTSQVQQEQEEPQPETSPQTTVEAQTTPEAQPTTDAQPTTTAKETTAAAPASSSSSQSSSSNAPSEYAQLMVDIHNKLRAQHSAGTLEWDSTLALYAQNYADLFQCSLNLVHSKQYPENLAVGYGNGPDAVQAWYDEGKTTLANQFNHFTQVVWKAASKLGCGIKDCTSEGFGYYINCNYDKGNLVGSFAQNVIGYGQ